MTRMRVGSAVNPSSITHAALGVLSGDDHPQYLTEARADVWLEAALVSALPAALEAVLGEPPATLFAPMYDAPLQTATVTISSEELLALNAVAVPLLAAPGAGKAIIFVGAALWLDFAGTAYDGIGADEDLTIRYTDKDGTTLATLETTGFLNATADAFCYVQPTTTAIEPVVNAPLVLHLSAGEIVSGDSPLRLRLLYRVIDLPWEVGE